MSEIKIKDTRVDNIGSMPSPHSLMHAIPSDKTIQQHIHDSRKIISDIIHGNDTRLLAIVGPCSIHDEKAAIEYATRLKRLADELHDQLYIVMRVYFEKPRTNIGWQGLINDPYLDETFNINEGLSLARKILLNINQLGLPVATEFVDTITPQYIADLVSWAAIGARTVESQAHRMLASGLSMPVGFKNNTAGNISAAVNAVYAATQPHRFLSVTEKGEAATITTTGNTSSHIILRGGKDHPNFDAQHVSNAVTALQERNLHPAIMIDCSHDNSSKDYLKQSTVIENLCDQIQKDDHPIIGFMLESNLVEGKQVFKPGANLRYGQSITDGCIGWDETTQLLKTIYSTHHGQ